MKQEINYSIKRLGIILVVLLGILYPIQAQRKYKSSASQNYSRVDNTRFHYGYSIGIGVYDYRIHNSRYGSNFGFLAEQVTFSPALRLGVIGEMNLDSHFSIRTIPGLYFGKHTVSFKRDSLTLATGSINPFTDAGYPYEADAAIKSVYLEVPLLLKYRGQRINNYNFYLIGGVSYRMDLTPHNELDPAKDIIIKTKKHDFALELGGGMDFYPFYYKLGVELRISIGLIDMMNHELDEDYPGYQAYTRSIADMKSTIVTLSFNFE